MRHTPQKYRPFFEACGRRGGLQRARRLSSLERSAIAARAANARWGKWSSHSKPLASVRLNQPRWNDPTYIEELLSDGSLADWREIYLRISDKPFGPTATALERVLSSTEIYGVTALWKGILKMIQGNLP